MALPFIGARSASGGPATASSAPTQDSIANEVAEMNMTVMQSAAGSADMVVPVPFVESALDSIFGTLAYIYVLEQRTVLSRSPNIVSTLLIVFCAEVALDLLNTQIQANTSESSAHLSWLMWYLARVIGITSTALGLLVFGVLSGMLVLGVHANTFTYVSLMYVFIVCMLLFMFVVFVKKTCQTDPAVISAFDARISVVARTAAGS
jgi:hypothetical protein